MTRILIAAAVVLCLFSGPSQARQCVQWHASGDGSYIFVDCSAKERAHRRRIFRSGRHVAPVQRDWNSFFDNSGRWPAENSVIVTKSTSIDKSLFDLVSVAASAAGVPQKIAHAVIRLESGYRPHLRGAAGEWGLGQIKCQTARSVGFGGACSRLADPSINLRYSMLYLRQAIDRGGATCGGVSLYNTGTGLRPHCTPYGRRIMAMAGA